jgi:hypothetical protein
VASLKTRLSRIWKRRFSDVHSDSSTAIPREVFWRSPHVGPVRSKACVAAKRPLHRRDAGVSVAETAARRKFPLAAETRAMPRSLRVKSGGETLRGNAVRVRCGRHWGK